MTFSPKFGLDNYLMKSDTKMLFWDTSEEETILRHFMTNNQITIFSVQGC